MSMRELVAPFGRTPTILVADDEPEVRNYLGTALGCQGFHVEFAENGLEALECARQDSELDLVLLDILMPRKDGLETLAELRTLRPGVPVIMLSGATSTTNIVTAMRRGAVDFLPKPVSPQDLCDAIERAMPHATQPEEPPLPQLAVTASGAWSKKLDLLLRSIGSCDAPVLLRGETGVGKEVLARRLHAQSTRAGRPFLKLNCAALPSELVESELFGYERGAFTGAFRSTPGKFELAHQGTILLDEIGDMDVRLQAKLLQVLQDREFHRLGAQAASKVNVNVIAATHCDLEQAIAEGRFREDLYYRLNVIDIHIPPLRDRRDEILPLANHFIARHATLEKPPLSIPSSLREALVSHDWPGNVRELENVMRKYLVLRDPELMVQQIRGRSRRRPFALNHETPLAIRPHEDSGHYLIPVHAEPSPLNHVASAHKAAEADAIVAALNAALWNRKQAAAALGIDYKALLYKMKKLNIGKRQRV